MAKRIPETAFEDYFAMGAGRSYEALAEKYGVTKRAITRRARAERWQRRIQEREQRTKEAVRAKVEESLEDLNARHLRIVKAMQAKALEYLKTLPMATAMDAVRTLEISIKQERLIHGEPSDRSAISVEETIRREYERWLVVNEDDGDGYDRNAS